MHFVLVILALIWTHFIADFVCQSDRIALNKSKNNMILLEHVLIYTVALLGFGIVFALVNGVLHFITDYITSRITAKLWANHRHWFFVTIGFDQAIHFTCLLLTAWYLNAHPF